MQHSLSHPHSPAPLRLSHWFLWTSRHPAVKQQLEEKSATKNQGHLSLSLQPGLVETPPKYLPLSCPQPKGLYPLCTAHTTLPVPAAALCPRRTEMRGSSRTLATSGAQEQLEKHLCSFGKNESVPVVIRLLLFSRALAVIIVVFQFKNQAVYL